MPPHDPGSRQATILGVSIRKDAHEDPNKDKASSQPLDPRKTTDHEVTGASLPSPAASSPGDGAQTQTMAAVGAGAFSTLAEDRHEAEVGQRISRGGTILGAKVVQPEPVKKPAAKVTHALSAGGFGTATQPGSKLTLTGAAVAKGTDPLRPMARTVILESPDRVSSPHPAPPASVARAPIDRDSSTNEAKAPFKWSLIHSVAAGFAALCFALGGTLFGLRIASTHPEVPSARVPVGVTAATTSTLPIVGLTETTAQVPAQPELAVPSTPPPPPSSPVPSTNTSQGDATPPASTRATADDGSRRARHHSRARRPPSTTGPITAMPY